MKRWLITLAPFLLFACATTEETLDLRMRIDTLEREMETWRQDSQRRILKTDKDLRMLLTEGTEALKREVEDVRRMILDLSVSIQNQEERLKALNGKMEEIKFQSDVYRKDLDASLRVLKDTQKALEDRVRALETRKEEIEKKPPGHEAVYREAFEAFQRGAYDEAVNRFSFFLKEFPDSPMAPNALFWKGESHMKKKEYERAIATFQDLVEKHPRSGLVPQAMLSQSEAFFRLGDKKGTKALLEKVIALFPESEEARLARIRLKSLD